VDPLADAFPWVSAYNYALNNPLRMVDLNGMEPCPYDESEECGVIMDEVVVEAERPEKAVTSGVVGNTFYFDSSSRSGRNGLYAFLRSNPNAAGHLIGNDNYSMAAQQIAFNANIHTTQAVFLNNSARVLSAASMLTGLGVGGLGIRMLVTGRATLLTSTATRISMLERTTTGLSAASASLFAASGDTQNTVNAAMGATVGQLSAAARMTLATQGLKLSPGMNGVLYRSVTSGQTVPNKIFGTRHGAITIGATWSSYFAGKASGVLVEPNR
jgi:hypothetical protein